MLLVELDQTMDLEMGLDIAITVGMFRDTEVGLEAEQFRALYKNSSVEVQSLSKSGFSKLSTTFPSQALWRGSM